MSKYQINANTTISYIVEKQILNDYLKCHDKILLEAHKKKQNHILKKIHNLVEEELSQTAPKILKMVVSEVVRHLFSGDIDLIEDLLWIITNYEIGFFSDCLLELYLHTIIDIDFDTEIESCVWERYFYCFGSVGRIEDWGFIFNHSVEACGSYMCRNDEKYRHFTFSFVYGMLQSNLKHKNIEGFNIRQSQIVNYIYELPKDRLQDFEKTFSNLKEYDPQYKNRQSQIDYSNFLDYVLNILCQNHLQA